MEKAIRRAKKEGKIAKTAQQTIPYEEMYPDGICRITNRLYSKSVLCDDINYAEASDDEKAVLFELYCKLVNYFGPSVGFELSVICYPADLVEYRKMLALNPQGDQFDEIRKEYSDMLVRQVSKSRYERRICLTYTIEADGIRQARSRLEQIDNDVVGHFRALTVAAHPMDGYERLTILHRCLHLEENRKFRFNWDSLNHTGLSSKDYIAPSSFFFKDGRYFRSGASFGAVSFLQIRATKLYDTLLNSILNMEGSQIVSIHAKALDQNAALKAVKRKLSDLDKAKIDEQKRAVRSGFDMDILPPDLVTFGKEAQKLLEDLQNHDEKMFMVTILVVHAASSRQKLENLIYSANGITNTQNCDLIRLDYQQEQGFVSALPIGINQVEIQRGLTTSGTAIFLPFRACEVFQPKGVYYGLNATTNRMILADRKTLKCPNGVVLGTPGSGKSFSCKREAADVYLHTTDDLLFLDPENEYTSLCQQLSGQVIRLAPDSHDYINPLDVDLTTNTGENPLLMKADFIMSFCELILSAAQGGLKPIEKSVIDRCIPKIYRQLIKDPRPENMPILGDLYECLRAQQEEQAQELATALELYVFGSLNYLNHRTNVNVDNRVACYDISGLGQNLKKPGMLTVQNNIWQRTIVNRYAGKTTRIYLDEFHLLLKEPQTAAYTAEIYKRFRKWNGIPTSLTQNVKDLLESPEIENILENSDFILMLNQAASDRNILAQRLGISPQELGHITNSDAGEGLLFFGDKIIPFVDKFPTDTKLYQVKLLKANHESQRYALEDNLIKFYPQAIKREQETIADLETDIRHLEAHTPPDKEHFSMTVMGTTYTEKKEAGQAIIAAFESLKDLSDKVELGEYRGFPMTLWVSDSGLSPKLQITLKHTRSHTFEPGSDPFGNITRMDNVLEGMRDNLEQHQTVLGNLLQQMEDAKVEVKRPFPQEAELAEKSERLAALNVALNIGGKDKPNSRERQKHDGKTSIKRLLRRMGVESAASAAPKKDKEMEVAI